MHITTHSTLTPDEALRGTRAFKRLWYAVSMSSGALMVLLGFSTLSLSLEQRGMGVFMTVNGLLFLLLPEAILRWARLRRGTRAYSPMDVELDDEGLTLRTDANEGTLPWPSFAKIQRRSGFWIFRISLSHAILLPERVLDANATEALEAFLQARKLLA